MKQRNKVACLATIAGCCLLGGCAISNGQHYVFEPGKGRTNLDTQVSISDSGRYDSPSRYGQPDRNNRAGNVIPRMINASQPRGNRGRGRFVQRRAGG